MQGKDKSKKRNTTHTSRIASITFLLCFSPLILFSYLFTPFCSIACVCFSSLLLTFTLTCAWAGRGAWPQRRNGRSGRPLAGPLLFGKKREGGREGGREEEMKFKYVYVVEARVGLVFRLSSFPISLFTIPSIPPSLPPSLTPLPPSLPHSLPPFVPNSAGCAAMR